MLKRTPHNKTCQMAMSLSGDFTSDGSGEVQLLTSARGGYGSGPLPGPQEMVA